jgi:hypothetical protein
VQFRINSAWNESTGFAPFELTRVPRTLPAPFADVSDARALISGEAYVELARQNCAIAADHLLSARTKQAFVYNKGKRPYREGHNKPIVGNLVWLSTKNLAVSKSTARKLAPKFVGLYKVARTCPETDTFELGLPKFLVQRNVHNRFHIGLLRPWVQSDDRIFPNRIFNSKPKFSIDMINPNVRFRSGRLRLGAAQGLIHELLSSFWEGESGNRCLVVHGCRYRYLPGTSSQQRLPLIGCVRRQCSPHTSIRRQTTHSGTVKQ